MKRLLELKRAFIRRVDALLRLTDHLNQSGQSGSHVGFYLNGSPHLPWVGQLLPKGDWMPVANHHVSTPRGPL